MATYQEQLEKYRKLNEEKKRAEAEKLSPEQIKNWREMLVQYVGPFAHIMPEEMIYEFRTLFQKRLDVLVDGIIDFSAMECE